MNPVTVGELRHELDKYQDDTLVIVASDEEGNGFSAVYSYPIKLTLKQIRDRLRDTNEPDLIGKKLLCIN